MGYIGSIARVLFKLTIYIATIQMCVYIEVFTSHSMVYIYIYMLNQDYNNILYILRMIVVQVNFKIIMYNDREWQKIRPVHLMVYHARRLMPSEQMR